MTPCSAGLLKFGLFVRSKSPSGNHPVARPDDQLQQDTRRRTNWVLARGDQVGPVPNAVRPPALADTSLDGGDSARRNSPQQAWDMPARNDGAAGNRRKNFSTAGTSHLALQNGRRGRLKPSS